MKQILKFTLAFVFILFLAHTATMAQLRNSIAGKGVRLSAGVETGIPTGDFNSGNQWNLGGSLQADFNVAKRVLFVTANAGYNRFFMEDEANGDISLIPVKAGLKYFPVKNLYIQGETGVSFVANKSKIDADRSAAFIYAPQIGYLIRLNSRNYLDAGIRFESQSKIYSNGSRLNFFGLRVAYAFDSK